MSVLDSETLHRVDYPMLHGITEKFVLAYCGWLEYDRVNKRTPSAVEGRRAAEEYGRHDALLDVLQAITGRRREVWEVVLAALLPPLFRSGATPPVAASCLLTEMGYDDH